MYQNFINIQQLLPVGTDWIKEHNHLRPSLGEVDRLKLDLEHLTNWFVGPGSTVLGTKAGLVSGAPMQRPGLNLTDGKIWQFRDWNELRGASRAQGKSGLHNAVSREVGSGTSAEQVQKDNDLVLAISLAMGLVPASLMKETIP